jgi:cytoskeletal protein CcmA (bactofilin family)
MTDKWFRQQKGSVLLVVLLVTTLFTIMGLLLITVSFSHTKQINKEINRTQATNAAEMGLKEFNWKVKRIISENIQFDDKMNLIENLSVSSDDSFPYSYSVDAEMNKQTKRIAITSTGRVNGEQRVITQNKILFAEDSNSDNQINGKSLIYGGSIKRGKNVEIGPPDATNESVDFDSIKQYFKRIRLPLAEPLPDAIRKNEASQSISHYTDNINFVNTVNISHNVVFDKNVMVHGDFNGSGNITIKGDLYIDGTVNLSGNITVCGDVYIKNDANLSGNINFNRNVFINQTANISGNVHVKGDTVIKQDFNYEGGSTWDGYVYVGNNLIRKNDSSGWGQILQFNNTVFVNHDVDLHSNKVEVQFNNGLVVSHDITLKTSANGKIIIHKISDWNSGLNQIDESAEETEYN